MARQISPKMLADLTDAMRLALVRDGIVNVPQLAEEIRRRNESENVALEDVQAALLFHAKVFSAAMEFDGSQAIETGRPDAIAMQ